MSVPTQEERIASFQDKIKARKVDGVTWLETITDYCEEHGLEVEDIVSLISPWLKSQIKQESVERNLLKTSALEKNRVAI